MQESQLTRRPENSKISTYPETRICKNLSLPGDPKTPKSQLTRRPENSKISTYPETRICKNLNLPGDPKTPKSQLTQRPGYAKISAYPETRKLQNLNSPGDPKTPKSSSFNIPPLINTAFTMSTTYIHILIYIAMAFPTLLLSKVFSSIKSCGPPPSAKFNLTFLPLLFSAMGKNKWVSLTWCLL